MNERTNACLYYRHANMPDVYESMHMCMDLYKMYESMHIKNYYV